jgi:hypothetical protein
MREREVMEDEEEREERREEKEGEGTEKKRERERGREGQAGFGGAAQHSRCNFRAPRQYVNYHCQRHTWPHARLYAQYIQYGTVQY